MPPPVQGSRAIAVGSRYQAQDVVNRGTFSRLWDKVTRTKLQQVAIHLPAAGTVPARHVATGIPQADFRRLMRLGNGADGAAPTPDDRRDALVTARDLLAAAAIAHQDIGDGEAVLLAQKIGRGEFSFIFRDAPEPFQSAIAALECYDPQLATLALDVLQLGLGDEHTETLIASLLKALRSPQQETELPLARTALEEYFKSTVVSCSEGIDRVLNQIYGAHQDAQVPRQLERDRLVALELAALLVNDKGRLMSPAGIEKLIQGLVGQQGAAVATPAEANRQRMLKALADAPAMRSLVSSIGDSGTEAVRLSPAGERIVRAAQYKASEVSLNHSDVRRAAVSALLTPLRQGEVGSCFATSVATLIKDVHPSAFLRDIKRMLEDGELVRAEPGARTQQKLPISSEMDTSQLEEVYEGTEVQKKALMRTLLQASPDFDTELTKFDKELDDSFKLLVDDAQARANGGAGEPLVRPEGPTLGEIVRQVIAVRHGATAVVGDVGEVRSRMRDLITERNDLKTRVVPESNQRIATSQADRDTLKREVDQAKTDYDRLQSLPRTPGFLGVDHELDLQLAKARFLKLKAKQDAIDTAPATLAGVQARLANIDARIIDAEARLVRFAEAEGEIKDPEGFARDLDLARAQFLSQLAHPVLRAWEYTLASEFERAESGSFAERLKDSQSKLLYELVSRRIESAVAEGGLRRVPESFASELTDTYMTIFNERARYAYDASKLNELAAEGSSKTGSWRLYVKEQAGDPGLGRPIRGKQEFKELTMDLLAEAGERLSQRYRGRVDVPAFAKTVGEELFESDSFVESLARDLRPKLRMEDDDLCQPWLIGEGGSGSRLVASAWGLAEKRIAPGDGFAKLAANDANTAEMLVDTVIANVSAVRAALTPEQLSRPERVLLPAHWTGHAFVFQPGHRDLQPLLSGAQDGVAFKAALMQRGTDQLRAQLSYQQKKLALQAVGKLFPVKEGAVSVEFKPHLERVLGPAGDTDRLTLAAIVDQLKKHLAQAGVSREKISGLVEECERSLFVSIVAPACMVSVADLNSGSGSAPFMTAFAYNPFQRRFEAGVAQAGEFFVDDRVFKNGFALSAAPSLVLSPPAAVR